MGGLDHNEISENEISNSTSTPSEVPAREITEQSHEQLPFEDNSNLDASKASDTIKPNADAPQVSDSVDPKNDPAIGHTENGQIDTNPEKTMTDEVDRANKDVSQIHVSDDPKIEEDVVHSENEELSTVPEKTVANEADEPIADVPQLNDPDDPKTAEDLDHTKDKELNAAPEKTVMNETTNEPDTDTPQINDSDDPKTAEDLEYAEDEELNSVPEKAVMNETDELDADTPQVNNPDDPKTAEDLDSTADEESNTAPDKPELDEDLEAERKKTIDRTPIRGGYWSNPEERGNSTWIPNNADVKDSLAKYGKEGIDYIDGYPDMSPFSAWNTELYPDEYNLKDGKQFEACNDNLSAYFEDAAHNIMDNEYDNPLDYPEYRSLLMDTFKCGPEGVEDIQFALDCNETPSGYTWHHSQTPGQMDLVPTDIHQSARHRGGRSIWGGGAQNR